MNYQTLKQAMDQAADNALEDFDKFMVRRRRWDHYCGIGVLVTLGILFIVLVCILV